MKYYCSTCKQWLNEDETILETTYLGLRTNFGMQIEPDEFVELCPYCFSDVEEMQEGENCNTCDETFPKEDLEVFEGNLYCKKCLEGK